MLGYYVVKDSPNAWLVKLSRFGCNSEIVQTFTNAASARAFARKANQTIS